jgi:hypothetical protein
MTAELTEEGRLLKLSYYFGSGTINVPGTADRNCTWYRDGVLYLVQQIRFVPGTLFCQVPGPFHSF